MFDTLECQPFDIVSWFLVFSGLSDLHLLSNLYTNSQILLQEVHLRSSVQSFLLNTATSSPDAATTRLTWRGGLEPGLYIWSSVGLSEGEDLSQDPPAGSSTCHCPSSWSRQLVSTPLAEWEGRVERFVPSQRRGNPETTFSNRAVASWHGPHSCSHTSTAMTSPLTAVFHHKYHYILLPSVFMPAWHSLYYRKRVPQASPSAHMMKSTSDVKKLEGVDVDE